MNPYLQPVIMSSIKPLFQRNRTLHGRRQPVCTGTNWKILSESTEEKVPWVWILIGKTVNCVSRCSISLGTAQECATSFTILEREPFVFPTTSVRLPERSPTAPAHLSGGTALFMRRIGTDCGGMSRMCFERVRNGTASTTGCVIAADIWFG